MNEISLKISADSIPPEPRGKFENPDWTTNGDKRASVALDRLKTLWINTGTLCNIECVNCYIESSPKNDRLAYISREEVVSYLDEIKDLNLGTDEIGFTGGEPFLNPQFLPMLEATLERGFQSLVLTNAMQPMQRSHIKKGILELNKRFAKHLKIRVSLDHYTRDFHDTERGTGSFNKTVDGLNWLSANGFNISIAGRTCWGEEEESARRGYASLIEKHGWTIDPLDPTKLVLFPEMDENADVPEITTDCWSILNVSPGDMMCATSRMVVKRKGAEKPTVLPCTLIPYTTSFDMGTTLADAAVANGGMFDQGAVKLCHTHCSKFCVLGGGSCSVSDADKNSI